MSDNIPSILADADTLGGGATAREIAQQPATLIETAAMVRTRREQIAAFVDPLVVDTNTRIILAGAGTSAFAGAILAPTLSVELGRPVEAIATTDIVARPREIFADRRPVLLVSFARSGNSPESVAACELADALAAECRHLVITCNRQGRLFHEYDGAARSLVLALPEATDDQGFAMTSSVTAMMLAATGAFCPAQVAEARVAAIANAVGQVLIERNDAIREIAGRGFERIVYLGSGALRGLAEESALKILELTGGRMLSYHDTALGFRHGPKSLLDEKTLVLVYVAGEAHAARYDADLLAEVSGQLGPQRVIAIAPESAGDLARGATDWRCGGPGDEAALVYPYLVHAQLLALHASVATGRTPDNPFPSGEVNRVVKGVTVHPLD
ncbi:SIS domain-containing protein [Salinisphaera sp.]|uniref:SIS domain-containing protein n=1 Tax=Salinisphaera sp. TaxID=1914330 RepID=UPI002D783F84|nr:SIS domain-containing protein [Salinisphaera sp.]HET7314205.1 SIS domain-containing protein [Salinisphaera sp.]